MRSRPYTFLIATAITVALFAPHHAHGQSTATLLRKGNRLFSNAEYEAAFKVFSQGYRRGKKRAPTFLRSLCVEQAVDQLDLRGHCLLQSGDDRVPDPLQAFCRIALVVGLGLTDAGRQ